MAVVTSLSTFLDESFVQIRCSNLTLAYLKTVFENHREIQLDGSLTLQYAQATASTDFFKFQQIGDWSVFSLSMGFEKQHEKLTEQIGSLSYSACYSILRKEWTVYDELSKNISMITKDVKKILSRV